MRRYQSLAVLATLLVVGGVSCNKGDDDDSADISNTPIEILLQRVEETSDVEKQFDLVNEAMDMALREKDLPAFIRAHEVTVEYMEGLLNYNVVRTPADEVNMRLYLNSLLSVRLNSLHEIGIIYQRIAAYHPGMLDDWPETCPGDQETEAMIGELKAFYFAWQKIMPHEEYKNWNFIAHFDDETLQMVRNAALDFELQVDETIAYADTLGGSYSSFSNTPNAGLFMFSHTNIQRPDLLELKIERPVEVIDLGGDGIDRCDARLNGLQESQIGEANARYRDHMAMTRDRMKQRYPTLFAR